MEEDKNKKVLQLFEVLHLLKPESNQWRSIGNHLKLPDDYLEKHGNDDKSSDEDKLNNILTRWFTYQVPNDRVSFNQLKDALEPLNYIDKAEELLSKVLSGNKADTPNSTEPTLNQKSIDLRRKEIEAAIRLPANKECHGIILIVSGYNTFGAEIDVPNVENVFKQLNFVTYTALRNTTQVEEIACLIQAAADIKYPHSYQYVAFYFSGIGGLGKDKKMFLMGEWKENESDEVIYIEHYVINPLKRLDEQQISRLFFIEASRTGINDGTHLFCVPIKEAYQSGSRQKISLSGEIVAYAASDGQGSNFADSTRGSIWTYYLCKYLSEMKDEYITSILEKASKMVVNEKGDTIQKPFIKHNTISPAAKLTKRVRALSVEESKYIENFEKFSESRKSVSYVMVQVIPFGPPRVGKTCLYNRLLDQEPQSQRTTCNQSGKGSASTDVLSDRKVVQMIKSEKNIACIADKAGGKWNEVSGFEDQIAICMKTTHVQLHQELASAPHQQTPLVQETSHLVHNTEKVDNEEQTADTNEVMSKEQSKVSVVTELATGLDNSSLNSIPLEPAITDDVEPASSASEQIEEHSLKNVLDKIKSGKTVDFDSVKALDDSLMIYFTDTGGQPEFHEILPALVAGPTVFLLAFSLRESLDSLYEVQYESSSIDFEKYYNSFTVKEVLMGCLSSISCFKAAQAQDILNLASSNSIEKYAKLSEPPISVLMVGTHFDLVSNVEEKLREFNDSLYAELQSSQMFYEVIEQYDSDNNQLLIPVDNFNSEDGIKLRKFFDQVIYNTRTENNPFKITLPVNWLGFELYLKVLKTATVKYCHCVRLMNEFHMESEEELQSCLQFLHYKTGTIRYYNTIDELKDTVIIKPQVIFAAVTAFITSTFSSRNVSRKAAVNYKYYGLFETQDVVAVFKKHEEKLEIGFEQFIALLKHLNILSEWTKGLNDHENNARFFFPCALTHVVDPPHSADDITADSKYDPLLVSFDSGFLPKGVFSGLLAIAFNKWRIAKKEQGKIYERGKPRLNRNQAIFYVTENNSEVTIKATAKYLEISQCCADGDNPNDISIIILSEFSSDLKNVCAKLGYGAKFCGWKFGFYCSASLTNTKCNSTERHFAEISENNRIICSYSAKSFSFDNRQHWLEGIRSSNSSHLDEKMEQEHKARIKNCVGDSEYKNAQGIIFIIRMFGPSGTTKNFESIRSTFRSLNFAVLTFSDPTFAAIANLMIAAGSFQYPKNIKYIAVYYTGHGGSVQSSGKPFIEPLQTDANKPQTMYIHEKIIQPLRKQTNYTRLLLFDCCVKNFEQIDGNLSPAQVDGNLSPAKGEIIAFATYKHKEDQSQSADEGVACTWTSTLDDDKIKVLMREKKSFLTILNETKSVVNNDTQVKVFTTIPEEESPLFTVSAGSYSSTNQQVGSSTKIKLPTHKEIFDLLKNKSVDWDAIGRAFGIDYCYREVLRMDTINRLSFESKLEAVIARWMETSYYRVTWKLFDAVMCELGYQDIIRKLVDKGYIKQSRGSTKQIDSAQTTNQEESIKRKDSNPDCICDGLKEYDSHHWERLADELKVTEESHSSGIEKLNFILTKWVNINKRKTNSSHCEKSIQKPITVQAVYSALMEHASYWYEFAYELNLDEEYLDTLDNDELSLSNEEKFERAIKEWIENGDDVSWEKIIAVTGGEVINLPTQRLERASKFYLLKPSDLRIVIDCLKHKASSVCWNDLAVNLQLSDSFISGLTGGNDLRKLRKVIKEWLDEGKGYEPTWEKIIEAVKEVPGLGEEVVQKLQQKQNE